MECPGRSVGLADLPKPEKIVATLYKLSGGTTRWCKYEDIVAEAFRLFPEDFHLRACE
jgi:hypothetical protein